MQLVHCDKNGCSFTESSDTAINKKQMQKVNLNIVTDSRTPSGTDVHEADLCPKCLALLLTTFFGVHIDEILEIELPTFLGARDLIQVA